jgi:hypothetical protein
VLAVADAQQTPCRGRWCAVPVHRYPPYGGVVTGFFPVEKTKRATTSRPDTAYSPTFLSDSRTARFFYLIAVTFDFVRLYDGTALRIVSAKCDGAKRAAPQSMPNISLGHDRHRQLARISMAQAWNVIRSMPARSQAIPTRPGATDS